MIGKTLSHYEIKSQLGKGGMGEVYNVLFQGKYVTEIRGSMAWAIGRNGRFLMMKAVETTGKMPAAESPRKINVVLNWLEELKQKAPAD